MSSFFLTFFSSAISLGSNKASSTAEATWHPMPPLKSLIDAHPSGAPHCALVLTANLVAQEVECLISLGPAVRYGWCSTASQLLGPFPPESDEIFQYPPRPSLSAPFAFSNQQLQL